MDCVEDVVDHNSSSGSDQFLASPLVKRKRTKRQRPPATAVGPASSISSAELSSSTAVTEEDEDMANCLILLAQGRAVQISDEPKEATIDAKGSRAEAYKCKTCNKCFPSFQALGGHRTSHKKPKTAVLLDRANIPGAAQTEVFQMTAGSMTARPVATTSSNDDGTGNNKPRVHECSICRAEFSSGQALGGHMRRHRPLTAPADPKEIKKDRNVFSLDLNLPAPAEDDCEAETAKSSTTAFPFESRRPLVFSASSLVDCHY
ncbi:zinc finger protein ZAT5-like [Zingiber officinale]|uniref:C2H2-type domain-containing protein n=1 Tax=Zingiber officinale TaxID=94328 RepID=A0A8J5M4X4_ZINOF|nr:zinc finger protein ZAT5-like [Zingiber officinale]KAG6534206.1 hypothetical protein ZIOFF_008091 [Zingiber officinale]